jgi:hypothetical protein
MMPLGRGGCRRRTAPAPGTAPQTPALSVPAPIPDFLSPLFFFFPFFPISFSAAAGLAAGYQPESNFISSHLISSKSRPENNHSLIIHSLFINHYSSFILYFLFLLSIIHSE